MNKSRNLRIQFIRLDFRFGFEIEIEILKNLLISKIIKSHNKTRTRESIGFFPTR